MSIDTIYADWDSTQRLVANLAVSGVTFGEYGVRVVVRFMCLLKFRPIQEFGVYLYHKLDSHDHLGLHLEQCDHKFFKLSYIIAGIITFFNIRMEFKADWEYFDVMITTFIH